MGLLSRSIRIYSEKDSIEYILRNGDTLTVDAPVTMNDSNGRTFARYKVTFNFRNEKGRLVLDKRAGFQSNDGEGEGK